MQLSSKSLSERFYKSYGVRCTLFSLLEQLEVIFLQQLSVWFYELGTSRAQPKIELPKVAFFAPYYGITYKQMIFGVKSNTAQIYDYEKTDQHDFSNQHWLSCRIRQDQLF